MSKISIKTGNKYLAKNLINFNGTAVTGCPVEIWYCTRETKTCWQLTKRNPNIFCILEESEPYTLKTQIDKYFEIVEDLGTFTKTN